MPQIELQEIDDCAKPSLFIRYTRGHPGYKLYGHVACISIISGDVKFEEDDKLILSDESLSSGIEISIKDVAFPQP